LKSNVLLDLIELFYRFNQALRSYDAYELTTHAVCRKWLITSIRTDLYV